MLTEFYAAATFWLGVICLGVILTALAKLTGTVNALSRKLDMLMKHSGMNVQELANREALVLAKEGKKIEAIKHYREISGASLAEAKAAVEKLQEGAGPA